MVSLLVQFITPKDEYGYRSLTKAGNILVITVVALLVIAAVVFMTRKEKDHEKRATRFTVFAISIALALVASVFKLFELPKSTLVVYISGGLLVLTGVVAIMKVLDHGVDKNLRTIRLTVSAVSLALAFVTSFIELYKNPWGGSVTLFSMFFVCFVGYLYGPVTGLTAAFAYSILQFVQSGGSYVLSIPQTLFDYFLAFTALGIAGFFYKRKHGMLIGYIVACLCRGVFASIAGYLYWMDYMPENFPKSLTKVYPIIYNYSYILVEMALTIIVLMIPPVNKAIRRIAFEATVNRRGTGKAVDAEPVSVSETESEPETESDNA